MAASKCNNELELDSSGLEYQLLICWPCAHGMLFFEPISLNVKGGKILVFIIVEVILETVRHSFIDIISHMLYFRMLSVDFFVENCLCKYYETFF